MEKVLNPGKLGNTNVFIKVKFNDGKLSISGVVGPKHNGDAVGGCGQICMEFVRRNPDDNDCRYSHLIAPEEITFSNGWDKELWLDLLDIWEEWHNNELTPGCEHQRAEGWNKKPIDSSKGLMTYGKFFEGQTCSSWNMWAWVPERDHPNGLLSKACPVCGYKYGSAWLRREVPKEVIEFLEKLPETTITPAWV